MRQSRAVRHFPEEMKVMETGYSPEGKRKDMGILEWRKTVFSLQVKSRRQQEKTVSSSGKVQETARCPGETV